MNKNDIEKIMKSNKTDNTNNLPTELKEIIDTYEYKFISNVYTQQNIVLYVLEDLQEDDEYLVGSIVDICKYFMEDLESKMKYWEQDNKEFAKEQQNIINGLSKIIEEN